MCCLVCIQVQHLHLGRYLEMLKSAEFRDDLDVVSTVHTPKGTASTRGFIVCACIEYHQAKQTVLGV